ncbi:MAG: 30S ribosomal protein S2 [Patescibacteria group bacterium]
MEKEDVKISIEDMQKAGVNFGHTVSKLHPKMKPYVIGIRNNVHLIDLDKTAKEFERALKFIRSLVKENKTILFVGTKIQVKELVRSAANECQAPYVVERWLGGTLTNFETLLKRVDYFKDLESKIRSGELEKYTKKERMNFEKELQSLKIKFEGIKHLTKLPDAVLIFDLKKDATAVREAKRKGIKIIGVVDTNIDPTLADYPIPANDDAISSVKYILDKVQEVILTTRG